MKLFCLMAMAVGLMGLAGCESLTESGPENGNRMVRSIDTNGKEMVHDTESLLMLDRPSWLTDKPILQY